MDASVKPVTLFVLGLLPQFFVADGGQEILENFEQKLRECWGNAGDKKPVSMPFFAHAGRV